jgi:hypothetical protein
VLPPGSRVSGSAATGFDFGGQVVLGDFALPEAAHPGDTIDIAFTWQPTVQPSAVYSQFLHFFRAESDAYFVADREPFGGEFPTTAWQPGHRVRDCFTYTIPADAAPGTYNLHTGLYHTETGERLRVTNEAGETIPDASLPLHWIQIVSTEKPLPVRQQTRSGCGE